VPQFLVGVITVIFGSFNVADKSFLSLLFIILFYLLIFLKIACKAYPSYKINQLK
jgi:hypothetical protein